MPSRKRSGENFVGFFQMFGLFPIAIKFTEENENSKVTNIPSIKALGGIVASPIFSVFFEILGGPEETGGVILSDSLRVYKLGIISSINSYCIEVWKLF